MMSQEQNDIITRVGPADPAGKLMRMYWQPAALVDELEGPRPIGAVKLLGENFVLFHHKVAVTPAARLVSPSCSSTVVG